MEDTADMAIVVDPGLCQVLHKQLVARNNVEVNAFESLVDDWQSAGGN